MSPEHTNPSPADVEHARSLLHGLTWECPFGGNPTDCWCYDIRRWEPTKRMRWVGKLNDNECLQYYDLHRSCFEKKAARERGRATGDTD